MWLFVDEGGQISIYFLHLNYYLGALSLAFSVFVAIRIIQLIRKNFYILEGIILPPYIENRTSYSQLPCGSEFTQVEIKRRLQTSILAFVSSYFVIFITFQTVSFNLNIIGQYINSIIDGNNILLGILESLLIVSSEYIIESGTQDMNPESLAGNLFLLWVPATMHLIGFANISGIVYNSYRRMVCAILVDLVDR